MSKVIGIMSFKGGVGKSVSAINLAAGLHSLGKSVIVVDGNFSFLSAFWAFLQY